MPYLKKITVVGKMMIMEGSILLIPLMTLPFYNSDIKYVWMFIIPAFISISTVPYILFLFAPP